MRELRSQHLALRQMLITPRDHSTVTPTCYWCGEEEFVDILEVWNDREFSIETCCDKLWQEVVEDLNQSDGGTVRGYLADLLRHYGINCRQVFNSDSRGQIVIDSDLRVAAISRYAAQEFVRQHHRHNAPPPGDRWRHAVYNGGSLVAVAIVGRPVARLIDHHKVVEVNRMCVNHDGLARELTWKAASLGYKTAAEEAAQRGYEKIITYTLADAESGMSLRYARWKKDGPPTKGGSWNNPSRPRADTAPTVPKQRWYKTLNPRPQPQTELSL